VKPADFVKRAEKRLVAIEKETKAVVLRIKALAQQARSARNELDRDRDKLLASIDEAATLPGRDLDDEEFARQAAELDAAQEELHELVEAVDLPDDDDLRSAIDAIGTEFTTKLSRARVALSALVDGID
jgi:predicted  nucleic acid-binding Zn-ribbon protein